MYNPFQSLLIDKLRFYRLLSLALTFISLISITAAIFFFSAQENENNPMVSDISPRSTNDVPKYRQIMSLICPLEYSGLPSLLRKDVNLKIDFQARRWRLENIHRFDNDGQIILDGNRYGLCGELAAYTYAKINPLLESDYTIQFARVAESGFFLQPQSSHIALVIANKKTRKLFLLDPSFHRYGPLKEYNNYLFYEYRGDLPFLTAQEKDITFEVDTGTPIFIRNDMIIFLTVESVDEKFDKENFTIAITATRRYHYSGRYVFLIRKKDGQEETFENTILAKKLFFPEDYKNLITGILYWEKNQL